MADLLLTSPILTLFVVVALGAGLGIIPFGPVKFGAAGVLFVGLIIGDIVPELGAQLVVVQSLGLALFVYTVGLSAGQSFFKDLRKQTKLMLSATVILTIGAVVALLSGRMMGLEANLIAGIFAGSLTATPALAAATAAAGGDGTPGVGYSLGYPVGVIIAIILVSLIVSRKWSEKNDSPSLMGQSLFATTVFVENPMSVRDVPGWKEQKFKISYLQRGEVTRVYVPGEELRYGDSVVVVGLIDDVKQVVAAIGKEAEKHLADNRTLVKFDSFTVSSKKMAGRTIAALNMAGRFGAVVMRIHRGDLELLATDSSRLEIGDRVMVVYPSSEYNQIQNFFGDSEQKISQIDAISMGLGMVLGLLLGMVEISLPGGLTFSLGAAAGPLVVGMFLGALQKTGPFLWQMPQAANQTIRQLGLLIFLAATGISSGKAFMGTAFTFNGLLSIVLALVVVVLVLGLMLVFGKISGISAQRTAGIMAGFLGQPAVLDFAVAKESDERIEAGYAAIFAIGIILKIILATLIVIIK